MKRIFMFLIIGLVVMSGVCSAAINRSPEPGRAYSATEITAAINANTALLASAGTPSAELQQAVDIANAAWARLQGGQHIGNRFIPDAGVVTLAPATTTAGEAMVLKGKLHGRGFSGPGQDIEDAVPVRAHINAAAMFTPDVRRTISDAGAGDFMVNLTAAVVDSGTQVVTIGANRCLLGTSAQTPDGKPLVAFCDELMPLGRAVITVHEGTESRLQQERARIAAEKVGAKMPAEQAMREAGQEAREALLLSAAPALRAAPAADGTLGAPVLVTNPATGEVDRAATLANIMALIEDTDIVTGKSRTLGDTLAAATGDRAQETMDHAVARAVTQNMDAKVADPLSDGGQISMRAMDKRVTKNITEGLAVQDATAGMFDGQKMKDETVHLVGSRATIDALKASEAVQKALAAGATLAETEIKADNDAEKATATQRAIDAANAAAGTANAAGKPQRVWCFADDSWTDEASATQPANADVIGKKNVSFVRVGDLSPKRSFDRNAQKTETGEFGTTGANAAAMIAILQHTAKNNDAKSAEATRAREALRILFTNLTGQIVAIAEIEQIINNNNVGVLIRLVVLPRATSVEAEQAARITLSVALAVSA